MALLFEVSLSRLIFAQIRPKRNRGGVGDIQNGAGCRHEKGRGVGVRGGVQAEVKKKNKGLSSYERTRTENNGEHRDSVWAMRSGCVFFNAPGFVCVLSVYF